MPNARRVDLDTKVQELLDRTDIQDVLLAFARGYASHDLGTILSCFMQESIFDLGYVTLNGIDQIKSFYSGRFGSAKDIPPSPVPLSIQITTPVLTNIYIALDGDTAHCESTTVAFLAGSRDHKDLVIARGVTNSDDLVRTGGEWRIKKRIFKAHWGSEAPWVMDK